MSGGGFTLSPRSKILLALIIVILVIFGVLSFIKAFPFDNALVSVLLLISGIVLIVVSLILLLLIIISK